MIPQNEMSVSSKLPKKFEPFKILTRRPINSILSGLGEGTKRLPVDFGFGHHTPDMLVAAFVLACFLVNSA